MRELANVMVEMRDGVRLATDLYLPDEEGVYPAIAVRTPYIKERWKAQHLDGDQYMNPKKCWLHCGSAGLQRYRFFRRKLCSMAG